MSRARFASVVVALTFVVGACSTTATDFKEAAEKAIAGADGLGEGSTAKCDDPGGTAVGTKFNCVGTKEGVDYPYAAEITGSKAVAVSAVTATGQASPDTVVSETTTG